MAYVGGGWRSGQAGDIVGVTSTATVSSLSVTTASCNEGLLTQTVTGTGFANGDVIYASYIALPTTFISATQLRTTAFSPMPDTGTAGTIPVGVRKGTQALSNTVNFTATAPNLVAVVANGRHVHTAGDVVLTLVEAEPEPDFLIEDDFTGTDGAIWDLDIWTLQLLSGGGLIEIDDNQGRMYNGTPWATTAISATDFELTVKLSYASLSGIYPEVYWGMCDALTDASSGGYNVQFQVSGGVGQALMFTQAGYGTIATVPDAALLGTDMEWWIKVRRVGSSHKVKWWEVGDAEPGTWQMDVTDSTKYAGGRFTLRCYGSAGCHFDDYTVTDLSGITGGRAARYESPMLGGYTGLGYGTSLVGTDLTMCWWFQRIDHWTTISFLSLASDTEFWGLSLNNESIDLAYTDVAGHDMTTDLDVALNTWTFLSVSYVDSTGVATIRATPLGGSTATWTSPAGDGPTADDFYPWYNHRGDVACMKVWTAALSGSELATEMAHYTAQRRTNLWGEYSWYDGSTNIEVFDQSGNDRNLHVNDIGLKATPYTVAGPAGIVL